jgi:hypothetical protein
MSARRVYRTTPATGCAWLRRADAAVAKSIAFTATLSIAVFWTNLRSPAVDRAASHHEFFADLGDFVTLSPPAQKAQAREDQAGQASAGDRTGGPRHQLYAEIVEGNPGRDTLNDGKPCRGYMSVPVEQLAFTATDPTTKTTLAQWAQEVGALCEASDVEAYLDLVKTTARCSRRSKKRSRTSGPRGRGRSKSKPNWRR